MDFHGIEQGPNVFVRDELHNCFYIICFEFMLGSIYKNEYVWYGVPRHTGI